MLIKYKDYLSIIFGLALQVLRAALLCGGRIQQEGGRRAAVATSAQAAAARGGRAEQAVRTVLLRSGSGSNDSYSKKS